MQMISLLGLVILVVSGATAANAHPVDVYEQSSYLIFTADEVFIEITMTAGVEIGQDVLADVDTDGDSVISEAEGDTYTAQVIEAIQLSSKGGLLALTLVDDAYPTPSALASGTDSIRLLLSAPLPATRSGDYPLYYQNAFAPAGYEHTYLVNALVQGDARDRIDILEQQRDWYQETLLVSYRVLATEDEQGSDASESSALLSQL